MQRSTTSIRTLLGALALSAGLAAPMALGDEPVPDQDKPVTDQSAAVEESKAAESRDTRENADMVEVRVSLPDGRTIIRLEPKQSMSARYNFRGGATPKLLASGARSSGSGVSTAGRGASGGSNGASVGTGGSSGGGGGGAGASSGGGGGSGGSASGGKAADQATSVESSKGGFFYGASAGGSSNSESSSRNDSAQTPRPVPTVGNPTYDREGNATGGQRVEFYEAGMSAAVVGNRLYFIGVELVSANAPFEIITGTRVSDDLVIMDSQRLSSSGSDSLSSFNTANSQIKLEMESGTVVDLVLFSRSADADSPERVQRTWSVRIR